MSERVWACVDGNEAAARVAHRLSDVCAIYPITPASNMGELADAYSAAGRTNLWGVVPAVVEFQSEAGAAGALHGAVTTGALGTTFTASQGLLLMLPVMYKIAGELTPAVIHVAARALATHALSIFGDHSDVMSARGTGWVMLSAASVQEAHDFALISHAATLRSRVPVMHFFDGFRTSHEVDKISLLDDDDLRALIRESDIAAHRARRLSPEHPQIRGTAQNPDVFFQGREAANTYYDEVGGIVARLFADLGERTGRNYGLVDYYGDPEAERVIVLMGSGTGAAREAVEVLRATGERVGVAVVRLYRPFPSAALAAALPATVKRIAVLDRCKEPGAPADPLHLDVLKALSDHCAEVPVIVGGRYGLGSKEFTPAMVAAVFTELQADKPRRHFTIGIVDDVTGHSLTVDQEFAVPTNAVQALFYGLGSDGTVGANKTTIKLIGEHTDLWAQGYFVYDSRKSGAVTVSHLRFGPDPIDSTYLITQADFVACHQFGLLERLPVLESARPGATLLLNSPYGADEVWEQLPANVQAQIVAKGVSVWVIDANRVAKEVGLGSRINTVMQPCFFALSGVLPVAEAIDLIKESVTATYAKRGASIVSRNHAAIDLALAAMSQVVVPEMAPQVPVSVEALPAHAPAFVRDVVVPLLREAGDLLPVSAMPVDGSFPSGTAQYEKRAIATEIPVWDPDLCIDCGKCVLACPHSAIRMKVFGPEQLAGAPEGFLSKPYASRDLPAGTLLSVQVAPDDCTGCGICVDVCPARSKEQVRHKSLDLAPAIGVRPAERPRYDFFLAIPEVDRLAVRHDTVKGSQLLQPLFEFSGACSGCGETPYLSLLTRLFGDRMLVANATGCSSIYGANLPTTPWSKNAAGRGPAWSNSLFEDNAEFGLGMRLAVEHRWTVAQQRLATLASTLDPELVAVLSAEPATDEADVARRRVAVESLKTALAGRDDPISTSLIADSDDLTPPSVWIVGGDGWAYDIGFGGLDHVLASGRNVNVLVLDTEVYSNTGGQASKATPRGAAAKFATSGKGTAKKDLGLLAQAYGDVYVAQIAIGANEMQTVRALQEAAAWPGPSLVIAYSTCIAHGIEMSTSMSHQRSAVASGYWPLYRVHPSPEPGTHPVSLDSKAPSIPVREFMAAETRFSMPAASDPERAEHLGQLAQADVNERWHYLTQLAGVERSMAVDPETSEALTTPEAAS